MSQKKQNSKNALSQELQQLPYPAYLLDEEGTFISRNKAANPRLLPIRMRSMIDRYLSCADRKRVEKLNVGEEVPVDIQFIGTHGAIVYRCADGYWIAMRNLIAHLLTCVQQSGKEMPPFFSAIEQQISGLHAEGERLPEELHVLRENFRNTLRYHTEMTMYLHYTSEQLEPGKVCEVTAPLKGLLTRAEKFLRPNGFRPNIQTVEGPVFVNGEAEEIRYATALMIACAAEHLRDQRHLSMQSVKLEEEYLFSVLFEPLPEGELYRVILSGEYEKGLPSAFGTLFFQLLLLKNLANAKGWRFSVVNAGNREGFLRMTLALPLTDRRPLRLSEAQDPLPLLKVLLSFLFPSEDETFSPL